MSRKSLLTLAGAFFSLFLVGCQSQSNPSENAPSALAPAGVDSSILTNADQHPGDWMTYGRTYSEQRFSPLSQINDQNVGQLGLAWYMDLDTRRGQEATPLVVDGKMFFTTAWSKVFAVNAATGEKLWSFDPKVPPEWAINACCDVVNRGVAVWQGKVFVGTLDGRLLALDAATGNPFWETLTIDPHYRYTITGAPRVVKGRVLIGNGGAEFGVRGYISAYDAATGKLAWRFYTVPGDPAKPFESVAIENAAKTWTGSSWKSGAGGTVWDSIVYDPDLDLVYFGVGNGSPWNRKARSPRGGDNLFTCSVVALNADTGEYAWHYQETPGDGWDYDSAESLILADLIINKTPRKVLLHAPKNGFFYVLDGATGDLISANPYTVVSWATRIDSQTGRPVENPQSRYEEGKGVPVVPGPFGAHSWHPMSFSPFTKLVYIPVQDAGFLYKADEHFENRALGYNAGVDLVAASLPQQPQIKKAVLSTIKGHLSAWDPVQQKEIWRVDRPSPVNGGVLSTAGNLIFEGTAQGNLEAYRAGNGQKLWSADAQSGIVAPPITYTVNGEQYVAVLAGWGGVFPLAAGEVALSSSGRTQNISRLLAFKLGGNGSLPALPQDSPPQLKPPPYTANSATIQRGEALYQRFCSTCHGDVAVSGGVLPDLRYSGTLDNDRWFEIVLKGQLKQAGMVSFEKELSRPDAAAIRNYVIFRAHQSLSEQKADHK
jgi:quinohemoprotein ethanol dehydrogenase